MLSEIIKICRYSNFGVSFFLCCGTAQKCDQDLDAFTGEILNGKLHFLCSVTIIKNCCHLTLILLLPIITIRESAVKILCHTGHLTLLHKKIISFIIFESTV